MVSIDAGFYQGKNSENEYVGYITTSGLYVVLACEDNGENEQFDSCLQNIAHRVTSERVTHLRTFEGIIDDQCKQLPSKKISLSALFSFEDGVYLVCRGKGEIFIHRENALHKLLFGDKSASGVAKKDDVFILTTSILFEHIDEKILSKAISDHSPHELIELASRELDQINDTGIIVGVLRAGDVSMLDPVEVNLPDDEVSNEGIVDGKLKSVSDDKIDTGFTGHSQEDETFAPRHGPTNRLKEKLSRVKTLLSPKLQLNGTSRGKKITFVLTIILFIVFIWSVGLGNARRQKAAFIDKVKQTQTEISEALGKVEDIREDDPVKAIHLLDAADAKYKLLQDEADSKEYTEILELSALATSLKDSRNSVKKAENAQSEVFYELSLVSNNAIASSLYLEGETLAMLDEKNGKVYVLTISDKSVETLTDSRMKGASLVGGHQGSVFIFNENSGVTKYDGNKKENVIEKDDEWDGIRDMGFYKGNIYLLAAGNDEIYKYLVTENGYSGKSSYIRGSAQDFDGFIGLAIDGSVYVVEDSEVMKFTSGIREPFEVSVPVEESHFSDIFTSDELDNVYVLDNENGTIFIFNKDGDFQKQVTADILKNADDFVVSPDEGILVLSQETLYKIDLNR